MCKKYCLKFQSIHNSFFLLFLFSICKLVGSMCIHKPININIGTVIKTQEKFIPDHLKTKQICNYAVKELPFVIRYVPDRYKTNGWWNSRVAGA